MRFLKRLIYITAVVFVISCMLSGISIFRPDITDNIETFLYSGQESAETIGGDYDLEEETTGYPDDGAENEETGQKEGAFETEPLKNDVIAESLVSDYILPNQSEIVVPKNVSGRNGYQQIQENREQIDDEAAKELQNQIDTGYTGEGLDFDGVKYPYYAMLDDRGKHIYRQIYANTNELYSAFIATDQLKDVFSAVYNDHPEYILHPVCCCKYLFPPTAHPVPAHSLSSLPGIATTLAPLLTQQYT